MKKLLLIVPIILFSILGLHSCKKNAVEESYTETVHQVTPDLSTQIYASVSGFVTDENGIPIPGAAVKAGASTSTTDAFGYFKISNTNFAKTAGYVTVTQTGYFNGIRTFTPETGKDNFVRLQLIPKIITGNCNSSTGGTITTAEGASVTLPASGFIVASNNTPYSGTVHAAIHWLNPAEQGVLQLTMPGNLEGIDSLGYLQSLTTYGMLAVELTGDAGELLQLAPGHKASLNFPIPATLQSSAPANLPLWYFNEDNGLWQQDGSAAKNGSSYQGDVSHFSLWNCDVPTPSLVRFHAQIIDEHFEPIIHARVTVRIQGVPNSATGGYSDAEGQVFGFIPGNSNLLIEVTTASSCNSGTYTKSIVTTTAYVDLGSLTVPTGPSSARLTGLVNDCNGNPVTDGYVIIGAGNQSNAVEINNGSFNASIIVCPNTTALITAVDRTLEQQSTPQNITIVSGVNNFGTITTCTAPPPGESITYWIDNVPTTLNGLEFDFTGNHNISPDTTSIGADDLVNMVTAFSVDFSSPTINNSPGTYNVTSDYVLVNQLIYTIVDPGPVTVNVTNYDAVGNMITGTSVPFQVTDMGGNPHVFRFSFNVIRDN